MQIETRHYDMLIDGQWVPSSTGAERESINPFTGQPWLTVPEASSDDVDKAVRAAHREVRGGTWSTYSGTDRATLIRRLADLLAENADELARLETTDNGKPIRETGGQMAGLPAWYHYFAGLADKLEGTTIPIDKAGFLVYSRKVPVGVVGAILPWNSPLLLLAFKLAPALAAGCTAVVKPAEQTPASTLRFAELLSEAGFPAGVLNVVTGSGAKVGQALIEHPLVDKVAFTGSTETGRHIVASSAGHLPRITLELGGKSANIIFDDADLDEAVNGATAGIFAAGGQTCVAGSRLLVHDSVLDQVVQRLGDKARQIRLGDPLDSSTEMGPLAFKEHRDRVLSYLEVADSEGAGAICGGGAPSAPELKHGFFLEPTVLTNVRNDMRVAQEEVFGPVLCVMGFSSEEEAVAIANDTRYGLAGGLWTTDLRRAHRVAHQIRSGTVWVNSYRLMHHAVPFGGHGQSGIGAENGQQAMGHYTEDQVVWIELNGDKRDPFKLG